MTRTSRNTFIAFASAAIVTGIGMFAVSGTANAKNTLSCEGTSRQSVVECCETIVRENGTPLWMKQTGRNCSTSTKCRSVNTYTSVVYRCKLELTQIDIKDTKDTRDTSDRTKGRKQ